MSKKTKKKKLGLAKKIGELTRDVKNLKKECISLKQFCNLNNQFSTRINYRALNNSNIIEINSGILNRFEKFFLNRNDNLGEDYKKWIKEYSQRRSINSTRGTSIGTSIGTSQGSRRSSRGTSKQPRNQENQSG